jgi:hypothetical protein
MIAVRGDRSAGGWTVGCGVAAAAAAAALLPILILY